MNQPTNHCLGTFFVQKKRREPQGLPWRMPWYHGEDFGISLPIHLSIHPTNQPTTTTSNNNNNNNNKRFHQSNKASNQCGLPPIFVCLKKHRIYKCKLAGEVGPRCSTWIWATRLQVSSHEVGVVSKCSAGLGLIVMGGCFNRFWFRNPTVTSEDRWWVRWDWGLEAWLSPWIITYNKL